MRFPRQEYWNELPFPSPGDLPDLGIEPASLVLVGGIFIAEPPGKHSGRIVFTHFDARLKKTCSLRFYIEF